MRTFYPGLAGNPWAEFARMQREFDQLMGRLDAGARSRVFPPINIYESSEAFMLRAEVPGIDVDKLDISAARGSLTLKGERIAPELAEGSSVHRRERVHGTFARTFTLPDNVNTDKVTAAYHDGVLELTVPKRPEAQPRQITVQGP